MKNIFAFSIFVFQLTLSVNAQAPAPLWARRIQPPNVNTRGERVYGVSQVRGGGFVFVGSDTAYFANKYEQLNKQAAERLMVVRTDAEGKIVWGTRDADLYQTYSQGSFTTVCTTTSNEVVAAGFKNSYPSRGAGLNLIVAKYSNTGAKLWERNYGGTNSEYAQSIVQTKDGGFIVAGYTNSNDGDVRDNHGTNTYDAWVLKLDAAGFYDWKKAYGGAGHEQVFSIQQTFDGGYIIAGRDSLAIGSRGGTDGLIIKLNASGNVSWQKRVGGTKAESFKSVIQMPDHGYLLTGYTYSNDQDVAGNHGIADLWVVRTDSSGNIAWQKCFGGTGEDYGSTLERTADNTFIVAGHTESSNGNVSSRNGGADAWLINIDANGTLLWEKTVGTSNNDFAVFAKSFSENELYVTTFGDAVSSSGDFVHSFLYRLGNVSTVKGTVFIDRNSNGIKELNEPMFDDVVVKTTKANYQRVSSPYNGSFRLYVDTGTYTTTVVPNNSYYTVTPSGLPSTFSSYYQTDSFSFAIQPIPGKRDLSISLFPLLPARPGFATQYKLVYSNKGTDTIANGIVQLIKSNKLSAGSTFPAYNSIVGDTLRWTYANLKPGDSASILINFTVVAPPGANNGDRLTSVATVTPVTGDLTPADDTSKVVQTVIGSYDPNDKAEVHAGVLTQQQVSSREWLQYTIRFQNTGTDTAFNVVVRDTLSSKVDWSTLQMISSSHSYQLAIKDGDKCSWSFNNILLPDSNRNKSASNGYIVYRIKPGASLVPGDTVKNSASIYFDYNLPVKTNTERTSIEVLVLSVRMTGFEARRKGDKNVLQWNTSSEVNTSHYEIQRSADGEILQPSVKLQPRLLVHIILLMISPILQLTTTG